MYSPAFSFTFLFVLLTVLHEMSSKPHLSKRPVYLEKQFSLIANNCVCAAGVDVWSALSSLPRTGDARITC